MINVKLLGVFLSVGVGAGMIGLVAHLVLSSGSNDKPSNNLDQPKEEDVVETESSFFAVAIDESKKDSKILKKSCSISADCAVYKISGPLSFSEDESKKTNITQVTASSEVKPNLQYVIKLTTQKLNNKDQVEISFSESDKHYFEIKSLAAISDDNTVNPTLPEGILTKSVLWNATKDLVAFSSWTKEQKDSRKYYTDLYPTFIEREAQKHEDFLVLSWNTVDQNQLFWQLGNGVMLDRFIFKSMEDQISDKDDNSEITIDINSKEQDNKAVLEIYEIKNQEPIKKAFEDNTSDRTERFTASGINWDEIARENIMVTKLTALERGKYYKFVFKAYKKFSYPNSETGKISSIILKKVYLNPSPQTPKVLKIFEIDESQTEPIPSYCSYVESKSTLTYCKWMWGS